MVTITKENHLNVWEAIKERHSSKAYYDKESEISEEDTKVLETIIDDISNSFTNANEKSLMDVLPDDNIKVVFIKGFNFGFPFNTMYSGTKNFLGLVGPKEIKPLVLTKAAVYFQKIVVQLTQKKVETGWIGSSNFTKMLANHAKKNKQTTIDYENESIYAISPFGKGKTPNMMVKMIRKRKEGKKLFFESNFNNPLVLKKDDPFVDCFEAVRLAPSHFNKQTWKIVKEGNSFHFFNSPTSKFYSNINIGTALFNWAAICDHKKIDGTFEIKKDLNIKEMNVPKNATYILSYNITV